MRDYSNYYPSYKDVVLENGRVIFEHQLEGFEGKDIEIDNVPIRALIQYHTNPLSDAVEDRKLTCWKDVDLKKGSIVKILEDDDNYLVITKVKHNDLVKYTKLYYCNQTLTWQDDSNVIHTTPCILSDKTSVYSDGLSKTEFISLGTDQTSIVVQANEHTLKIPLNKRFIFKHDKNNIYEVNRRDNLTLDGLISFVVKKSLYSPLYDNLELNIANYNGKQPEPEPKPPEDTTAIEITGAERFTIWDKDNEYSVNTTKPVLWTLNKTDIIKIISTVDNKCFINPVGTSKIGESIIRCTLVENEDLFVEKKISLFYQ